MPKLKINYKDHWDNVYSSAEISKLGWYEVNPETSLKLIKKCKLNKSDVIIDIGSGASTIIDKLIDGGFENIIIEPLGGRFIVMYDIILPKKLFFIRFHIRIKQNCEIIN